jgi:hypothetical protein
VFKKTIKDNEGKSWLVKLDIMRMVCIRDATGFDLMKPEVGQKLKDGALTASDLAWYINSPKAIARGIAREDFFDRFDTPDITQASVEALQDFIQSLAKELEAREAAQTHGGVGPTLDVSPPWPESSRSHDERVLKSLNEPMP